MAWQGKGLGQVSGEEWTGRQGGMRLHALEFIIRPPHARSLSRSLTLTHSLPSFLFLSHAYRNQVDAAADQNRALSVVSDSGQHPTAAAAASWQNWKPVCIIMRQFV